MVDSPANRPEGTNPMPPMRCVIAIDQSPPVGRSANAAAVIALTIGQRHPVLVSEPLIDASGFRHPGLIPIGIAVLVASQDTLSEIRQKGMESPMRGGRAT